MGGGGVKDDSAQQEKDRQAKISQGMTSINNQFAQFDPTFYQKRADDYSNWATPQMQQQYDDAAKNLTYALARQYGTLDTSEAASRQARLAQAKTLAEGNIADQAQSYADTAKNNVENERTALVNQLQATADPSQASSEALRQAGILTNQSQAYSPLQDLFSNVMQGLGTLYSGSGGQGLIANLFKDPSLSGSGGSNYSIVK